MQEKRDDSRSPMLFLRQVNAVMIAVDNLWSYADKEITHGYLRKYGDVSERDRTRFLGLPKERESFGTVLFGSGHHTDQDDARIIRDSSLSLKEIFKTFEMKGSDNLSRDSMENKPNNMQDVKEKVIPLLITIYTAIKRLSELNSKKLRKLADEIVIAINPETKKEIKKNKDAGEMFVLAEAAKLNILTHQSTKF